MLTPELDSELRQEYPAWLSEAEAVVDRWQWAPLGAAWNHPIPYWGALVHGTVRVKPLNGPPKDIAMGELYGRRADARIVLTRKFRSDGGLYTEEISRWAPSHRSSALFEHLRGGREGVSVWFSTESDFDRGLVIRHLEQRPESVEQYRMTYDADKRCVAIDRHVERGDGATDESHYELSHDESGLVAIRDAASGGLVFERRSTTSQRALQTARTLITDLVSGQVTASARLEEAGAVVLLYHEHYGLIPTVGFVPRAVLERGDQTDPGMFNPANHDALLPLTDEAALTTDQRDTLMRALLELEDDEEGVRKFSINIAKRLRSSVPEGTLVLAFDTDMDDFERNMRVLVPRSRRKQSR